MLEFKFTASDIFEEFVKLFISNGFNYLITDINHENIFHHLAKNEMLENMEAIKHCKGDVSPLD
jgi:hypothetical protein